jgi:metal-sulfur cluster biosynthetic enzyme/nitrite reductase/ring-hydroxylating ferredoxin subunit
MNDMNDMNDLGDWTPLATIDELQPGDRKSELVDDEPVLLVRVGEEYFCIDDVCTHDGQPLTDGPIADGEIACPRHGARFSLETGEPTCMPAVEKIATYEVRLSEGQVWVRPAPVADTLAAPAASSTEDQAVEQPVDTAAATESDPQSEEGSESDDDTAPQEAGPADAVAMLEALREVIDPELMINIVDLGLIYDVRQDSDDVVTVDMTLTSPACPAGPQLVQQSKMALERLEGITEAQINLVMTPPWTPERMTDDARDKLGIF